MAEKTCRYLTADEKYLAWKTVNDDIFLFSYSSTAFYLLVFVERFPARMWCWSPARWCQLMS